MVGKLSHIQRGGDKRGARRQHKTSHKTLSFSFLLLAFVFKKKREREAVCGGGTCVCGFTRVGTGKVNMYVCVYVDLRCKEPF